MEAYFTYVFAYWWLILPGVILAMWAQYKVKSTYAKYSQINSSRDITGYKAARYILDAYKLDKVPIEEIPGKLSDHYDPRTKVLRLSTDVYRGTDVAAIGVAAHEVGHAIQDDKGYIPLKLRNQVFPVASIGSRFGPWIILLGFIFGANQQLMSIGIVLFSFYVLFSLVTLPVEFNASSRAIKLLTNSGLLTEEESVGSRKVLNAAALTYVAASLTAILTLLRYVLLARSRD